MMEVPWMLGLVGNCRATTVVANGTANYNNTHVKAQAWGAMSTDACRNVKLTVTNCHIETVESGYGSYADGSSNTFSGTTFDVNDYGLIITGGSGHFTDGCVVNSGRFGVMSHQGSGKVTIDKGCVFNTKKAVLQVKSGTPTFIVDNSTLKSDSGIILQAMMNDDPNKNFGSGAGPVGGSRGSSPEGMPAGAGAGKAVTAIFRNMTLSGDIYTSMTSLNDVVVTFEKATITGAITTATAQHAVGPNGERLVMQDKTDLYYLIGEEIPTYSATDEKYGMKVSLDADSTWVVSKTSYLTSLSLAEGAVVGAPEGQRVTMTVNGAKKPITAGTYEGKIVLTATPGA